MEIGKIVLENLIKSGHVIFPITMEERKKLKIEPKQVQNAFHKAMIKKLCQ